MAACTSLDRCLDIEIGHAIDGSTLRINYSLEAHLLLWLSLVNGVTAQANLLMLKIDLSKS